MKSIKRKHITEKYVCNNSGGVLGTLKIKGRDQEKILINEVKMPWDGSHCHHENADLVSSGLKNSTLR